MGTIHHPDIESVPLSAVLQALADSTRLEIVRGLSNGPCSCKGMDMDIPKSRLSHHVKVLRQAGVIRQEADGAQRITSLRKDELDARFPGLMDSVIDGQGPI